MSAYMWANVYVNGAGQTRNEVAQQERLVTMEQDLSNARKLRAVYQEASETLADESHELRRELRQAREDTKVAWDVCDHWMRQYEKEEQNLTDVCGAYDDAIDEIIWLQDEVRRLKAKHTSECKYFSCTEA